MATTSTKILTNDCSSNGLSSNGLSSERLSSEGLSLSPEDNPYKLVTRRIDTSKIKLNYKRELDVKTSTTHEMNIVKETAIRSGAIIYTKMNNQTYFCLGIDTESENLTDFGGGVKKGETVVEGGLRELEEESQGVFGIIKPKDVERTLTFHCYNMAIMFIELDVDIRDIEAKFKERIEATPSLEVSGIVWLDTHTFLESIHGRGQKMYIRVRHLLNKVTNVIKDL